MTRPPTATAPSSFDLHSAFGSTDTLKEKLSSLVVQKPLTTSVRVEQYITLPPKTCDSYSTFESLCKEIMSAWQSSPDIEAGDDQPQCSARGLHMTAKDIHLYAWINQPRRPENTMSSLGGLFLRSTLVTPWHERPIEHAFFQVKHDGETCFIDIENRVSPVEPEEQVIATDGDSQSTSRVGDSSAQDSLLVGSTDDELSKQGNETPGGEESKMEANEEIMIKKEPSIRVTRYQEQDEQDPALESVNTVEENTRADGGSFWLHGREINLFNDGCNTEEETISTDKGTDADMKSLLRLEEEVTDLLFDQKPERRSRI